MNTKDTDIDYISIEETKKEHQKYTDFGYYFCKGIFNAIANYFIFGLILYGIISGIIAFFGIGVDDSDFDKYTRSGVEVITDYKYGTQYLKTVEGHIVPRLDKDGKHVVVVSNIHKKD